MALCDRETLKTLPPELEGDRADNAILAVALKFHQHDCQCPVVLVSKDTNLRIKADALGLNSQDYEIDKVDFKDLYTGITEIEVSPATIEQFFQDHEVFLEGNFYPNQALTLVDETNPSHTALAMVEGHKNRVVSLITFPPSGVSRIHPRNREQRFALNLLLRDSIPLVTLVGKAGTGKTLLAIAAGLQKVADEKEYTRLLISRPIVPMGKEFGLFTRRYQ